MTPQPRRESGLVTTSIGLLYTNAVLILLMVICPGLYMIAGVMGLSAGGDTLDGIVVGGVFIVIGVIAALLLLGLGTANLMLAHRLRSAKSLLPAMILSYAQAFLMVIVCLPACLPSLVAGILLSVELATANSVARTAAAADQQSYHRHDR